MTQIAIVSEGVTDQIVLEQLVFECIEFEGEEPEFIQAQPIRDLSHSHTAPHGGWGRVLEYCEKRLLEVLQTNDFVIIQIDTDCGSQFGVDMAPGGKEKGSDDLVSDTIKIISDRIGRKIFREHREKIIFAISVHSIESWVMYCLFDEIKKSNAFNALVRRIGCKCFKKKRVKDYRWLASRIKFRTIQDNRSQEESLKCFLNDFASKVDGSVSCIG